MASERQDLVNRTEERITSLQKALKTIQATRQRLNDSSVEVKSKIQSIVSRQLETLRNREVWLLNQVDVLEQTKEQVLRVQEDTLHQALGSLSNSLEYSMVDDDGLHFCTKLSESLERLDRLELRPLESSLLSFRADVGKLRTAIREFGHVDSRGLNLENAFVQHGETPSPSLPHAFEDYGDAEHHVLYKTLADIKHETDNDESIKVSIPRLTKPTADWLTWTPETTPTPTPTRNERFHFPPFQGSEGKCTNIQEWLAQIKYETATEEDEYEVIQPSSMNWPESACTQQDMTSDPETASSETSFPYFDLVKVSSVDKWLKPGGSAAGDESVQMLAYFTEATRNSQQWLLNFKNQMERIKECSHGGCTKAEEPMVDIENLDRLCCMETSPSVVNKANNLWLLLGDDDKDVDEVQFLQETCRANETCNSFSDCLCDENCSSNSASPASSCHTSPSHTPSDGWFSDIPAKSEDWLCKPKSATLESEIEESPLFTYFHTLPSICHYWLQNSCSTTSTHAAPETPKNLFSVFNSKAPLNTWLLPRGSSCGDDHCSLPGLQSHFKSCLSSPLSVWLKRCSETNPSGDNTTCSNDPKLVDNLKGAPSSVDASLQKWLFPHSRSLNFTTKAKPQDYESLPEAELSPWHRKRSLSAEDLDMEKCSDVSTAVSVNDVFSKMGLGQGSWLRPGGNCLLQAEKESQDEDENDSIWLKKKEGNKEKRIVHGDGALFQCFHDNQLSKWLCKTMD